MINKMGKYGGFLVLLVFMSLQLLAVRNRPVQDKILVISSYSPLKEGSNHIISSFLEKIDSQIPVKISVEYMDSESYPDFNHWTDWLKSLFVAYETPPKLVVLIGGEVWAAYRECCMDSWRQAPVF